MLFCPALWNIAQYYPEVQAVNKINNWNNQEFVFTELIKMIPATVPFIPMVKVDNRQWDICAMAQKTPPQNSAFPLYHQALPIHSSHPLSSKSCITSLYQI